MKCDLCGKSAQFGDNISHSKRHTNRRWEPNIHPATIIIDGKPRRLNLCTRCLRSQHKASRVAVKPE
jgi:large subunit ribosomal protein L28